MQRAYPARINWENEPSTTSPINDTNLNKMDSALYTIDGRVVDFDTTKANQSDLLTCLSNVDYNTTTGVFTFTWKNGTTTTVDLNVEKIPVSFSMDANGVITMTTADGSTYTADVSSLIKTYTFTDSSEIDFTVNTDASGNKTVTAIIKDGSITGSKLQPNYLADCQSAQQSAQTASTTATSKASDAEAWAVGTRNGQPVPSTDPTYHNNSQYWSQQSAGQTLNGLSDVNIDDSTLANGHVIKWNATNQEWENGPESGGTTGDYIGLYGETEIPSASDLNNYTTIGNYYFAGSGSLSNCPVSNRKFKLVVEKLNSSTTNDLKQTLYCFGNENYTPAIYARTADDGSFSFWYPIYKGAMNLDDMSDVSLSSLQIGQVLAYIQYSQYGSLVTAFRNSYLSTLKYDADHTLADMIPEPLTSAQVAALKALI